MSADPLLEIAAIVLFFFLPGYVLVRALWPEWRVRGEKALERGLTEIVAALVLSLVLTILVGFVLGNVGAFQAGPSDPLLEGILAGLSGLFFTIGFLGGAYAKEAPPPSRWAEAPLHGEEDGEEYMGQMEAFAKEERRLRHQLRVSRKEGPGSGDRVQRDLDALLARRREIELEREARLTS